MNVLLFFGTIFSRVQGFKVETASFGVFIE